MNQKSAQYSMIPAPLYEDFPGEVNCTHFRGFPRRGSLQRSQLYSFSRISQEVLLTEKSTALIFEDFPGRIPWREVNCVCIHKATLHKKIDFKTDSF
jgi:hypothetical protein